MKILATIYSMGTIDTGLADFVAELKKDSRVTVEFSHDVPYDSNRNRSALRCLEGGYDYHLTIDEDNPPTKNPLDFVGADKDVIGFPTPVLKDDLSWNVGKMFEDGYKFYLTNNGGSGLEEIDVIGSGCLLIARRVYEAIKNPFQRVWDDNGLAVLGADLRFCERVREAGMSVWCAWDYPCRHFKRVDLLRFA